MDAYGLYIHIPFCRRRCPYCDFTIAVQSAPRHQDYAERLLDELTNRLPSHNPRTIYVGGGTPSLWEPDVVRWFGEQVHERWEPAEEITVEFNPECARTETLAAWTSVGADRISLGAQSLDADTLSWLGRAHTPGDVIDAITLFAEHGISNVSVDIIYGVPSRGRESLERELGELLDFDIVTHISAYELTWEPLTPLDAKRRRGELRPVEDESIIQEYWTVHELLTSRGFEHYEVSSYARGGRRAKHNSSYWQGIAYLGAGVGAHSYWPDADGRPRRTSNIRSTKRYLEHGHAFDSTEVLDPSDLVLERAMLGLRCDIGVHPAQLVPGQTKSAARLRERLADCFGEWARRGYGDVFDGRFQCNATGYLQSDWLAVQVANLLESDAH